MNQPRLRIFTVTLLAAWTVAGCSSDATETVSTDGADASDVGAVADVSGTDAVGDATGTPDIADTSAATDAASVDANADAADAPDAVTPVCYSDADCTATEYCKIVPPACAGVCARKLALKAFEGRVGSKP